MFVLSTLQMIGIIYKYTSPSGKIYIGQTTREKRRRQEFQNLNMSYGGEKIDNARLKYSPAAFTYEVLCSIEFATAKEAQMKLDELEQFYIQKCDSYRNGYNMTLGGYTTLGMKASEETRRKLSQIRKGRKGKPRTDEQKKVQSQMMKALYANPEWRARRLLIDGSEEYRKKLSERLSGEGNGMWGRKASKETRAKMSEARLGEKHFMYGKNMTEERKEKCRIAALRRHQEKPMSSDTIEKIRKSVGVAVAQYSKDGIFIKEYPSALAAGQAVGIDQSGIIKVCKGKRKIAGGFQWKYAGSSEDLSIIDKTVWLSISEAVELSGHCNVVLYYHMDVIKDLSFKQNGKRRYINKADLIRVFKVAS